MKTILFACLFSLTLGACAMTSDRDAPPSTSGTRLIPISEMDVAKVAARPGDLDSFKVMHRPTGIAFNVYYDTASAGIAQGSIPLLASFYRDVAALTGADAAAMRWHAVVFARNADKLVLHRDRMKYAGK